MNLKRIKDAVVDNLPLILGITVSAVIVTAFVVAVRNAAVENNALIDEINEKLANGTASMLQDAQGNIHVFW